MKVLIIGGAGFLGCNLARRCLIENSCQLTVLDSLDPLLRSTTQNLHEVWSDIHFIKGDIRNEKLLQELVTDKDIIFNCAAQTSHSLSMQYPLLDAEINCLGSIKLLEAVRLYNPNTLLVYSSSSTVVGKTNGEIVNEDHLEKPLEIYSANKGVAEKYYHIYHRNYNLNTVVIRFANLYGPFGKGYSEFGFVNYFIHLAWTNQTITIFGMGNQTRNIMYVEDATECLWKATQDPHLVGDTYLAVSKEHYTVRHIAENIVKVFGSGKVIYREWPEKRRRIEIGNVQLSGAKLHALTGWESHFDFNSGLKHTKTILDHHALITETPPTKIAL